MFYAEYIKLCNKIGKSPSAVAEELGFQKASVTRWKQGSIPTDRNKQRIADYFGVSVNALMGGEKEKLTEPASLSRDEIKFAVFGDANVDDDLMDDVISYAKYKMEQKRKGK